MGALLQLRRPDGTPVGTRPSAVPDPVGEVFGPAGILARSFPGYEPRPQQVELAQAVHEAFTAGQPLAADAPCGTGKSVAYLVPAIWAAAKHSKNVVVATANNALLEQLVTKDLPALQKLLPWSFTFGLLKGRNNYLCRLRANGQDTDLTLLRALTPTEQHQADQIEAWAQDTRTGDKSELPFLPSDAVWRSFSMPREDCRRTGCAFHEECFASQARARAEACDVLVTNQHLLFAHVQVRALTGLEVVLPPHDLVVLDEAHEAAGIAREFFGFKLTPGAWFRLAGWVRRTPAIARALTRSGHDPERFTASLRDAARGFFDGVGAHAQSPAYETRLRAEGWAAGLGAEQLLELTKTVGGLARARAEVLQEENPAHGTPERRELVEAQNHQRRAAQAALCLARALTLEPEGWAHWIETEQGQDSGRARAALCGAPVDVGGILRRHLWESPVVESAVAVSATLATGAGPGGWSFVRQELGLPPETRTLAVASPFDFSRQALLVLPSGLPGPREPGFAAAVAKVLGYVIRAAGGRTLGLFTSYKVLDEVHSALARAGLPYRLLRQGEAPRTQLVEAFKADTTACLLGTTSLWTGIDAPGETCSAVVVDKLPFPSPGDPLNDAITEAAGDRWFAEDSLPRAIIALRQGVGRLIRSKTDRGVVVLCDARLTSKPYGARVIAALGLPARGRLEDIGTWLDGGAR